MLIIQSHEKMLTKFTFAVMLCSAEEMMMITMIIIIDLHHHHDDVRDQSRKFYLHSNVMPWER